MSEEDYLDISKDLNVEECENLFQIIHNKRMEAEMGLDYWKGQEIKAYNTLMRARGNIMVEFDNG